MKALVFYDIVNNKTRNQVIDILFDYDFHRIQFSTFLGNISKTQLKKLSYDLNQIINSEEDSLYIFNICERDFKECQFLGKITNNDFSNNDFLIF